MDGGVGVESGEDGEEKKADCTLADYADGFAGEEGGVGGEGDGGFDEGEEDGVEMGDVWWDGEEGGDGGANVGCVFAEGEDGLVGG